MAEKRDFDKEMFKRSVVYNVKTLYRRTMEEATEQQIFQAVCYAVKDAIIDSWMSTKKEIEKTDPKTVYYMSMEFLMGRALGNNLINLTYYDEVKEALEELGCDRKRGLSGEEAERRLREHGPNALRQKKLRSS